MKKLYIATAVIALLLSLVSQLPARLAWQWWGQAPLVLAAPQGTVFSGQAVHLGVQQLVLAQPQWRARFWPLLTFRLRYELTAEIARYPLQTELTLSPTGSLRLDDLQAGLPLAAVTPLLRLPVMPLDGLLAVDMAAFKSRNGRILHARGQAEIRNAEWLLMQPRLALGNLRADISTDNGVITAELSSTGPLELQGQAQLRDDGSYEADIGLRSRPEAEARLENLLKTLGGPVDGWYRIKTRGTVPGQS